MNPRKNPVVTRGPWGFGDRSGTGIDGCVLEPTRHRPPIAGRFPPIQRGQLYGLNVRGDYDARNAEVNRLAILYGYCERYGRNSCGFVMSRAARKRGFRTFAGEYARRAARFGHA